jgi:predicted NAD/FAD-binding protein
MRIAVVGSGISGMSAAWLLAEQHQVTLYEANPRLGGHSHTVDAPTSLGPTPVDMGFIVYNEPNYPNLTALFAALGVETQASNMTFAVSLDGGATEYAGTELGTLFAQPANLVRPRFWAMLYGLQRFYRTVPVSLDALDESLISLADYLRRENYPTAFIDDHLLPMAAAIWSAPPETLGAYPASSFIRFARNHGLISFAGRPEWRTVTGGSRRYVERLTARYADSLRLGRPLQLIRRNAAGVTVIDDQGVSDQFDAVVVATHADQALALLEDPTVAERELLGAFRYERNLAVLHTDPQLMPRRRKVWSSWNYLGRRHGPKAISLTYWMNRLQAIEDRTPLFVTLNPATPPRAELVVRTESFEHPIFDAAAVRAQRQLWSLQGSRRTYYCGAYFGAGFHEDGLQAGLAVAEAIGPMRRPWRVVGESDRIHLGPVERLAA